MPERRAGIAPNWTFLPRAGTAHLRLPILHHELDITLNCQLIIIALNFLPEIHGGLDNRLGKAQAVEQVNFADSVRRLPRRAHWLRQKRCQCCAENPSSG